MALSRRQVVLALLIPCLTAFNAYANIAEDAQISASAAPAPNGAGGGTVSTSSSWYAAGADRTVFIALYPVNAAGGRGAAITPHTFAVPAGAGAANYSFGPLASGNYVAVITLTDSLGNVRASDSSTVTVP